MVIAADEKLLNPSMGAGSGLDAAMILFDQIVQILRRAQLCASWEQAVVFHFAHRAMGGGIAVQGNSLRRTALMPDCLTEERLRCFHVPCLAESEVDSLPGLVHRSI
jgi:hypothetical protein